MRHVVDTSAFFSPPAIRALVDAEIPVVVPAVVFTERARQIQAGGGGVARFERDLATLGFRVEPYGVPQALRYAMRLTDARAWKRLARDAMIAGHVAESDHLWTANPRDFSEIGVPEESIVRVPLG